MNRFSSKDRRVVRRQRAFRCGLLALAALSGAGHLSPQAWAQTNAPSGPPHNRWLLVVETSRTMRPRTDAARNVASMLVYSGMDGQAKPGDTIGLWTFNERLSAGQFPLQEWEPASNKEIARRVYLFLGAQKWEKQSRLDTVLPDIQRLIRDSQFISIFLISDGLQEIHGTPFDDKINAAYRTWRSEQEKSDMPFVTLLRAKAGRITDYVVDMPPWPLKLPPLPTELEPHKAPPPKTEKPQPRVLPPLILSGRRTESPPEPPPTESPNTNRTSSITAPAGFASSNEPVTSASTVSPIVPTEPRRTSTAGAGTVSVLPARPGTVPAATGAESPVTGEEQTEVESPTIARPVERGAAQNAAASAPQAAPAIKTDVVEKAKSPLRVSATTSPTKPGRTSQGAAPDGQSVQPAAVQTAVTLPQESLWNRRSIWIIAGFALAAAFAVLFILIRRSRTGSGTSLITRSFEREHKGE